jgi:ABC-type branched-subunit amino acid transport system permease subunit
MTLLAMIASVLLGAAYGWATVRVRGVRGFLLTVPVVVVVVVVLVTQEPDSQWSRCVQAAAVGVVLASLRSQWEDRATRRRVIDAAEERIRRSQGLPTR